MEEEMAHQEGGWPLGLQPLNVRVRLLRSLDFSGSLSFSTLVSGSSRASSVASTDFDTESTASLFHNRGITLGNLIGITNILELPSRSLRRSRKQDTLKGKKSHKSKTWFSLCTKPHPDSEKAGNAPSLGHFLEVERRASSVQRTNGVPIASDHNAGLTESQSALKPNSLASNDLLVPDADGDESLVLVGERDEGNTWVSSNGEGRPNEELSNVNGYGFPLLFPCIGGQCNH